jgi:pilus assembly protein CpaE
VWPAEREPFIQAVVAATTVSEVPERRAAMFAIHGARGGVGATFIATHLAAALARDALDCILLDLDLLYGDVGAAIGAPTEGVHTLADLLPLLGELSPNHLDDAMWRHPAGFRTLLAPEPEEAGRVETDDLSTIIDTASASCDAVVLHLSRTLDEVARTAPISADRILEVLSLDVLSFRATTRALEAVEPLRLRAPIGFVVNRSARSEILPGDISRVFGTPPLAVLPFDRAVVRAQDHGRLLPPRGRLARTFDRLAANIMAPADGVAEGVGSSS